MTHFLNDNNSLYPNQHGFRDGWDCLSKPVHDFENILKVLGGSSNTDVIYLELSKLFVRVNHTILLEKNAVQH